MSKPKLHPHMMPPEHDTYVEVKSMEFVCKGKLPSAEGPRVVHHKRERCDVYVGRPSRFGNPYSIFRHGSREEVIEKYRAYVLDSPTLLKTIKRTLRGKVLGCWCAPLPCHADVLLEIANE